MQCNLNNLYALIECIHILKLKIFKRQTAAIGKLNKDHTHPDFAITITTSFEIDHK